MRYRDRLLVQPRVRVRGTANQNELVATGPAAWVPGNFHPLSSEEIQLWGDSAKETGTWFCRRWPADMFCSITFRGAEWDQVAPAKAHVLGVGTKHVEVIIRKR